MQTTRGKVHSYLGMDLDYSKKGKVKVGTVDYVKDTISNFTQQIMGTAAAPAANHLFEVNSDCRKLPEELGREFHHTVAKLLFLCQRERPDITTAVSFLTTRV